MICVPAQLATTFILGCVYGSGYYISQECCTRVRNKSQGIEMVGKYKEGDKEILEQWKKDLIKKKKD